MDKDEIMKAAEQLMIFFPIEKFQAFVERESAQALSEQDLVPSEPVTVILSARGYARAAKGHDVDPRALSYKSGDEYLSSARGRSSGSRAGRSPDRVPRTRFLP